MEDKLALNTSQLHSLVQAYLILDTITDDIMYEDDDSKDYIKLYNIWNELDNILELYAGKMTVEELIDSLNKEHIV